ncbi:MAG: S8 family serine peptidase [Alphaproteobacteria bacterium]|nr:S8 family serine peptidase [Alphaproteobacteria bacterium]
MRSDANDVNIADNNRMIDDSAPQCAVPVSSAACDTEYKNATGLDAIRASYAYDKGYTGKGQTVSVLDTPFFTSHAEFKGGNVSTFITGYDASSGNSNISCSKTCNNSKTYHGTHVAGIIGARKNTISLKESKNTHGVAYEAKIKPIAVFSQTGSDNKNSSQLVKAINAGSGTNIIAMNNSWGSERKACVNYNGERYYYARHPGGSFLRDDCFTTANERPSTVQLTAWKNAVNKGTIVVFSNGNHGFNSENGTVNLYYDKNFTSNSKVVVRVNSSSLFGGSKANIPSYEGRFPEYDGALKGKWITVVAVDGNNNIAPFSNGCGVTKNYCLAAPGVGIHGPTHTTGSSQWANFTGTSQAAPHVSGSIALLKQAFPSMSSAEIVTLLFDSASDLGKKGTDDVYGRGMLNLQVAFEPLGNVNAVTVDNQPFGATFTDTSLTLANHFGTQLHHVNIGIGDDYNRVFIASPTKIDREPITLSLDDYMQDFTSASDHAETYALTPQANLNYQADDNKVWMKLIYDYGNSTASAAFYDNQQPKILPTGDSDERVLRAFAIRPTGENIAQMNVAHRLNSHLMMSSYAARGTYDTGHDFNELGSDFSYKSDIISIGIGIGHLREYQQFLGTEGTGAYALDGASLSQFTDINISKKLHKNSKFSLFAHYALYQTDVNMRYQQFADITDLQADHYQIGMKGANIISKNDNLTINFATKLGVTDGALVQHTVLGYRDDGSYNNVSNRYDLAVINRHRQLAISYQGNIDNRHERKNLPLQHRRFFATIIIDNHYQHQQDLTQTSLFTGITADL